MTPLGKSLVFAVKYSAEMHRVYWEPKDSDDELFDGLDDSERVSNMAAAVGEAACAEAADFLGSCAALAADYFRATGMLRIVKQSKPGTIKQKWFFEAAVERQPSIHGWWFCYGVSIYDQLGVVVPWFWRQGGRAWEEAVMKVLGQRAHSRTGDGLVSSTGTVALARIPIIPEDLCGFEVDRDPLVERVIRAFTDIQASDLDAILRHVREEGPEETSIE